MDRWVARFVGLVAVASIASGAVAACGEVEPEPAELPVLPPFAFPDSGFDFDAIVIPIEELDSSFDDATDSGFVDAGSDGPPDGGGFDSGFFDSDIVDAGGKDQSLPDGGWMIAAHYPMPTVIDFGGSVNASPVFTAITFPNYDLLTEAQQFVATVGATPYWTEAVGEYGVGPATAGPPILLTETAPSTIDDTAVQAWLAGKLDGAAAHAAFGTPNASTVYVVFYPTGTEVTLQGLTSCIEGGFGGYHNSLQLSAGPWVGLNVSYAVVPECAFDTTPEDQLTETASHELIEATTDPLPLTMAPTYAETDQNDIVWDVVLGGGEIADMCAQNSDAFFVPAGSMFPVQRVWSNEAALAGHDPCQPAAAGVTYFNAIPRMNASVNLTYMGQTIQTEGLLIPLHTKQTVEVDLYADGPIGDWNVSANDLSQLFGGGPYLEFSWDTTTGTNGTKLHLTITPLAAGPLGGQAFEVLSQSQGGDQANYWLGFVGQ